MTTPSVLRSTISVFMAMSKEFRREMSVDPKHWLNSVALVMSSFPVPLSRMVDGLHQPIDVTRAEDVTFNHAGCVVVFNGSVGVTDSADVAWQPLLAPELRRHQDARDDRRIVGT